MTFLLASVVILRPFDLYTWQTSCLVFSIYLEWPCKLRGHRHGTDQLHFWILVLSRITCRRLLTRTFLLRRKNPWWHQTCCLRSSWSMENFGGKGVTFSREWWCGGLVVWSVSVKRILRTADCRPGVKCRLRVKYRLQTKSKTQVGVKCRPSIIINCSCGMV